MKKMMLSVLLLSGVVAVKGESEDINVANGLGSFTTKCAEEDLTEEQKTFCEEYQKSMKRLAMDSTIVTKLLERGKIVFGASEENSLETLPVKEEAKSEETTLQQSIDNQDQTNKNQTIDTLKTEDYSI